MKILITGGLGFIGNRAAHYFKDKGHEIHIIDNTSNAALIRQVRTSEFNFTWYDITDPDVFLYLDHDYDIIIHCAAQTAVTRSLQDPVKDLYDNALGTLQMCELAKMCQAHLIYTSTNKVYGTNPNKHLIGSNDRYSAPEVNEHYSIDHTGHSPYGVSKLAADLYVQDYHRFHKIPTTVLRMSCIYGETQKGTEDQGWVYHITKQIINNEPVKIFGDGKQVRDILHVDDLVILMDKIIEKNVTGVYNVGGGVINSISVLELIATIHKNYANVTFHDWRPFDQLCYISDIGKINRATHWLPKISKEEGLARLTIKLKNL